MPSWRRILTALSLLAIIGCGSGDRLPGAGASLRPALEKAAAMWARFPVDANPRPIVMAGRLKADSVTAFPDGDSKVAFLAGQFDLKGKLPAAPEQYHGYPVITAEAAFDQLRQPSAKGASTTHRLDVTHARLGLATFTTDRGLRELPAWLFDLITVHGYVAVLAVAPSAVYQSAEQGYDSRAADISDDGTTLSVRFTGSGVGTGPCTSTYELATYESPQAVAVSVIEHRNGVGPSASPSDKRVVCNLVGYGRHAETTLTQPLGNRVVVYDTGAVLSVGRCAGKAGRTDPSCTTVD